MPKIRINDKDFIVHWTEEQNMRLLAIGQDPQYRKPCKPYKASGKTVSYQINWKKAEADGMLKGMPKMSLSLYSRRLSVLKQMYYNTEEWQERRRAWNKKHQEKYDKSYWAENRMRREVLFRGFSRQMKSKYGYETKQIWTKEQQDLLLRIVAKYVEKRVDWKKVAQDPKAEKLPCSTPNQLRNLWQKIDSLPGMTQRTFRAIVKRCNVKDWINWQQLIRDRRIVKLPLRYHGNINALRKYYWVVLRERSGTHKEKRRKEALAYKYMNYEKHRLSLKKRNQVLGRAVNDYLWTKVETN